jgi:hypothetical protein
VIFSFRKITSLYTVNKEVADLIKIQVVSLIIFFIFKTKIRILKRLVLLGFFVGISTCLLAQDEPEAPVSKEINEVAQFWISTNNVYRIADKWSILNDIHIRRTDFIRNPNFYFLRVGAQYYIKDNLKVAGGYAHLWLTTIDSWIAYRNENRIYQQFSVSQKFPKLNTLFRLRTEQRFFNDVIEGESLDNNFFVHRFRLLISLGFPFREGGKTQFMFADEIHLNFGKEVIYNTFNQNRLTLGIKHTLSKNWKFDCGYMMVYQQLATGFNYNLYHTFRLFFYGNFDFRKDKLQQFDEFRHGGE